MTLASVCSLPSMRILAALLLTIIGASPGSATPQLFWASAPVRPNETVLLQGQEFGSATVEIARLDDGPAATPTASAVKQWTRVPIVQKSDQSLKFILPADWKPGVFACRVAAGGATSPPILLNAPDPWWNQGDLGQGASPGGWLRVLGKSLGSADSSHARLEAQQGEAVVLRPESGDDWSLRFAVPADLKPGRYTLRVHNGLGGAGAWTTTGTVAIEAPLAWPTQVFNVLESYGKDAERQMRETLVKYRPVTDRTAGIRAALKKAKDNGGGVVYFPAGKYGITGTLDIPPRTVLRGEGTGLVVLWWGSGRFNLDGGDQKGLGRDPDAPKPPSTLIAGREFGLEDLSLYFPLEHQTGISAGDRFRMRRVRVRVDHHWAMDGSTRPEGTIARLGNNFEVADCDINAKGTGLVPGRYGRIANNRIVAGKTNCPLGGARGVIVEDNHFVSTFPTAYQNIAGVGRDLYYARNRHEAISTHQADYSFTFDAGPVAYLGKVAAVDGTRLTLADDPTYPHWAPEKHAIWRDSIVCIQAGRGAGQWRNVVTNQGRSWAVDRPFDCPPDGTSLVTIVPMNGRVLLVGNRFEDANWVNAGYGTAVEVVYAGNHLVRCAQLLNYGIAHQADVQPCWYVQYLANELHEGHTAVDTAGHVKGPNPFNGPITRCTVHRRQVWHKDNSGSLQIAGSACDVIVEGCDLRHALSKIRVNGEATGVLLRDNRFASGPGYEGKRLADAVILPPPR